jgi:hypothetical protein
MRATTMATMMAASQRSQGSGRFSATQAAAGAMSASAMVSQPFSSAKVSASASAASVPGREHRARCEQPRPPLALHQRLRRQREDRGEQQG